MSLTKAQNGENRRAIFTILRHLRRAKRGADGYIELTLTKSSSLKTKLSTEITDKYSGVS